MSKYPIGIPDLLPNWYYRSDLDRPFVGDQLNYRLVNEVLSDDWGDDDVMICDGRVCVCVCFVDGVRDIGETRLCKKAR